MGYNCFSVASMKKGIDMKIVINKCYGGYGLSKEAIYHYANKKCISIFEIIDGYCKHYYTSSDFNDDNYFNPDDIERNDPILIETIEELGLDVCNGDYAELEIVEIPDDVEFEIVEYDGMETIREPYRILG